MPVKTDIQNNIAVISMDDGKANAVNNSMLDDLEGALSDSETKADAVVLTGRAGLFSGGFDLTVMRASADEAEALVNRGAHFLLRLLTYPKPVVAACSGHAIAMGLFMVLASDTAIGAEGDFKLCANETANNMRLPVFGFELGRTGLHANHYAKAILFSAAYDPPGAVEAGMLDHIVAPDALLQRALAAAETLGQLPSDAFAFNKLGIRKPTIEAIRASLK